MVRKKRVSVTEENNLRMTAQRKVILEALQQDDTHPSADEIYHRVRRQLPRISLGTVYRNLEILSDLGTIQKLELGGTQKRFDGNPSRHYHIRCTCCDRVVDAPMDWMPDMERRLEGTSGYRVLGHRLEFLGLCPACVRHPMAPGLKRWSDPAGST